MRALDTYTGRAVERLEKDHLVLSGGIHIISKSIPKLPADALSELTFLTVIYDSTGTQMVLQKIVEGRQLLGKEWRVKLEGKYKIYDENTGEEWTPNESNFIGVAPPPHPDERVAEGPDEEYYRNVQLIEDDEGGDGIEFDEEE